MSLSSPMVDCVQLESGSVMFEMLYEECSQEAAVNQEGTEVQKTEVQTAMPFSG